MTTTPAMVPPTIAPTWDLCEAVTVEPDIALVGEGEVDEEVVVLRVSSGCIEIVGAGIFVAGWLPRLSVEAVLPSGPTISGKSDPWSALQSSLGLSAFDTEAAVAGLRRRRTGLKRALLDQTLVSGIGNIYADESLWRAKLHYERPTTTLTRPEGRRVLAAARDVMGQALEAGGTSFDALYVDVHGASGYFDRALAVYGREDGACPRCGAAIRRAAFMNRSSFWCPVCQPTPRRRHP